MPQRPFLFCCLLLLSAGCASTRVKAPDHSPVDWGDGVSVAELAKRNGLQESYEARQNRLLLSAPQHRVLLFPGTTVAVVDGVRLEGMGRISGAAGGWSVAEADARRIEDALRKTAPVGSVVSSSSPSVPGPRPSSAGPAPASHPTLPSHEPDWRVPLRREWRYVVIHHSATATGNAASFDQDHRNVRKWDGLGYDFVIGNGRGSGDGQVEVGYRWVQQQTGAHAGKAPDGTNEMNESGVGICLVGNFEKTAPTAAQRASLSRLLTFLRAYCGIPAQNVLLHGDVRDTACPGKLFPEREFLVPESSRAVPANRP